jgi:two-component sensor histidine kinase
VKEVAVAHQNRDSQEELAEQRSLAQFGELALKSDNLDTILTEACRLVGNALRTNLAKVLELQEDGKVLLVRAGVGWDADVVGKAKIAVGPTSSAGHAISTGEPVVSNDIEHDQRFEYPEFLKRAGVRAAVNTIVIGSDGEPPYGVLEVDSKTPGRFTEDDIQFLRTYANLIALAVGRLRMISQLRQQAEYSTQLLMELQHRVSNNLQVMIGLVRLQQNRAQSGDAADQLETIRQRIEALALVHQKLYGSGATARLSLGGYLGDLAATLLRFSAPQAGGIRLVIDAQEVQLEPQRALPLGLIVNEFIVNSIKYAFDHGNGTIGIRLETPPDGPMRLILWDDGKGLPLEPRSGLGLQLISGFARQIGASVEWSSNGGTRLTMTF